MKIIIRPLSLSLSVIPFFAGLSGCGDEQSGKRGESLLPNIIIILTDDQGYGDLSLTGNTNLQTPNIDRLAAEGTMFSNFYVCPVSSPTRAELLTGRYHLRSGVYSTSSGGEIMNSDETTIAQVFKKAGYSTAAFGKWHSGAQFPYHPIARGFDEFYGFCSGHLHEYYDPDLDHNGLPVKGEGFLEDDLTSRAISFIEQHRNSPFLIYLPYNTPHAPMQVPDEYWERFKDKELLLRGTQSSLENIDHTRAALAMCENIDMNVGRIMSALKEYRLEKNTIVLYFTDNGPNGHRWNDGMKGIKASTDEGGVRSLLLIKWKGMIPPGKRLTEIAGAIDLLPTLADFAGIEPATKHPLDGVTLKPLIVNNKPKQRDRIIFSHFNGRTSLRSNQFRYNDKGELYDMLADPGQKTDISGEKPEIAAKYDTMIMKWLNEVKDSTYRLQRFFPVGHPSSIITILPAADGKNHGCIQRSNKFPNNSYFTGWTSPDGKITWPVEVLESGEYDTEIYYTCPEGDEGSEIRISFHDEFLDTKIIEPHDPPLKGMEHDRVQRTESYWKDFRSMKAGVIRLEKGKGDLTVRALTIPGKTAMDLSRIVLRKKNDMQ